jgi:hypothetical protein
MAAQQAGTGHPHGVLSLRHHSPGGRMKRWSNEGPNGPNPMTAALQVEIRAEISYARQRMIYGVALAALGAGATVWTYINGAGHIVILGGGLVLGLWSFGSGYIKIARIKRYLDRHGVAFEAVKTPDL